MTGTATLRREFPLPTDGERQILRQDQLDRFYAGIEKLVIDPAYGECWIWKKGLGKDGDYGIFYLGKKETDDGRIVTVKRAVHVISYMHFVGPIPPTWVVDHMCSHKLCARPDHLETIPNLKNLQRAQQRRNWRRHNQFGANYESQPDWRFSL
jgi:hypothetical protein